MNKSQEPNPENKNPELSSGLNLATYYLFHYILLIAFFIDDSAILQ